MSETDEDPEDQLLRNTALRNAHSVLLARRQADAALASAQSELRKANEWLAAEKRILELIATGAPLRSILELLVRSIESRSTSGMLASVLLCDPQRNVLVHGAAPSLPEAYNQAIDGTVIGPCARSCGTAAFTGEPVTVTDIAASPLWVDYRDLARMHGLAACFSKPIRSARGAIIGTIAMYFRQPHEPDDADLELIRLAAQMSAIAIERARGEQALRDSEARFRATFEQAATGMAMASLDGRLLEINDKFCSIVGHERDELLGMKFIDITHPDDVEATRASVARLLSGEIGHYVLEKRYVRSDGSAVWSLTTVSMLRDADHRPLRFIGVAEDITQRRMAEEKLREETRVLELLNVTGTSLASNLDLHSLLQAITDAATTLSGAQFGAFFYNTTNESGDALMLYTLSGAPREAFDGFGHPRATAIFAPTFKGEGVIRIADVQRDPRYGNMAPHRGMPPGHLPVRSYLAIPVVSRSEGVLGGLFFGHPQPDMFSERHERIIVGVAAQAAISIDNARLFERAQLAAAERTKLLESEQAARADAERASALKDEFLATLSHELRTPLSAIVGWSNVLRRGQPEPAVMIRGLDSIERNARAQAQLIEDLLDMSRIASGKLRLDIQPVDPITFVEAAIETMRPAAEAKSVRLEKVFDPLTGPIPGDPNRLQQVVWNLLSNAIKFTPRGGKVQVLLTRVDSHVEIAIADSGIGVAPEFLPHVFERFRQADSKISRASGGLGIGLSIVKHLVELHGGSVAAVSDGVDQGATFTISLPLMAVHRRPARVAQHPPTPKQDPEDFRFADLSGVRILVVDDEPDARALLEHVLSECGAHLLLAGGAVEALEHLAGSKPDLLISDIGMPEVDGYQLIERVRALDRESGGQIPAIALTAFARSEDRTRALRAGFLVHVSKPVDPAELVATVASVVGRAGRSPHVGERRRRP